jgi:hypothetical protein
MMRRVLTAAKQKWMTSNSRNAAANSFDIAALNVRKIIGLSIKRHVRSS